MWLVLYGRALSVPGGNGAVSRVARFDDESEAETFIRECLKRGLRVTEPRKLGTRK